MMVLPPAVMPMRNYLVLAPSAAGKTFYARSNPGRVRDGDTIIANTVGWPPGRWWQDEEVAHITNTQNSLQLSAAFGLAPILFNCDPEYILDSQFEIVSVVIPSMETLETNARRRLAAYPNGVQPTDILSINRNCDVLYKAAWMRRWPVFSNINAAVCRMESHMRFVRD